tara:strand:+ start:888 stop:1112 length:225 start_codon:yes stop_codon:yes gene_type:complete
MNKDTFTVEYACDYEGDYTACITTCMETKERTFKCWETALTFINKCTMVHNLDELLNVVPIELVPDAVYEPTSY